MTSLNNFSELHLPLVEQEMLTFLSVHTTDEGLKKSMTYSIRAGGKRLRPLLTLVTAAAFQVPMSKGLYQVAAALEMIHTYSLIHDDLPSMDDDDLRRGQLTNHRVFGEALAILAGDGLLTLAFQLLSQSEISDYKKMILIQFLATAAGTEGMVAGQAADIEGEKRKLKLEELMAIHERKTGKLIEFAILAGGILANQPEEVLAILKKMAQHFGLAFQIRDDLLDVTSTTEILGKNVGRDSELNKSTYPALLGVEEALTALNQELTAAKDCILQIKDQDLSFSENLFFEVVEKFQLS